MYEEIKADASPQIAGITKYFQSMRTKAEKIPLVSIAPSLDIIYIGPVDVSHSEYAGVAKQAQYVLFAAVLTNALAFASCDRSIG